MRNGPPAVAAVAGIVFTYLFSVGLSAAETEAAIDLGSRLELFVDHYLIDSLEGARLRLHSPQKLPLPDKPVKGAYMTVIKDGNLYRAYYRDYVPGYEGKRSDGNPGEITCYAESRDGHNWTKPKLGLHEINGTRENNVILADAEPCSHNFTPFLDTKPGTQPSERYKALAGTHKGGGLFAFVSGDGIRWKKMQEKPVIASDAFAFDSQNVSFWSQCEGRYVCYFRTWETPHGRLRTISRTTSSDFVRWSEPVATHPNAPGEHLYTNGTHPYFRAPHIYIALPTRFLPQRGNSTDILLMTSRGGVRYERTFMEAFIRPGPDPERWGNRANYAALNVVPTGLAEMSVYHAGSGHRYVLRTDGFISVSAPNAGGEMRTKPLTFSGKRLVVNFATSAAGGIRVEIQTAAGKPIPDYSLEESVEIVGDAIERTVAWRGGADVSQLAGRTIRLRFVMRDADLYSLRFR